LLEGVCSAVTYCYLSVRIMCEYCLVMRRYSKVLYFREHVLEVCTRAERDVMFLRLGTQHLQRIVRLLEAKPTLSKTPPPTSSAAHHQQQASGGPALLHAARKAANISSAAETAQLHLLGVSLQRLEWVTAELHRCDDRVELILSLDEGGVAQCADSLAFRRATECHQRLAKRLGRMLKRANESQRFLRSLQEECNVLETTLTECVESFGRQLPLRVRKTASLDPTDICMICLEANWAPSPPESHRCRAVYLEPPIESYALQGKSWGVRRRQPRRVHLVGVEADWTDCTIEDPAADGGCHGGSGGGDGDADSQTSNSIHEERSRAWVRPPSAEEEEDYRPVDLRCGHLFHKACLQGWVCQSGRCPCCGEDLLPAILEDAS